MLIFVTIDDIIGAGLRSYGLSSGRELSINGRPANICQGKNHKKIDKKKANTKKLLSISKLKDSHTQKINQLIIKTSFYASVVNP